MVTLNAWTGNHLRLQAFTTDSDYAYVSIQPDAVLGQFTGSKFHEPSAIDERARIIDFLDQHLKS